MSASAETAVDIHERMQRPAGELPALVEIDTALAELSALEIVDSADSVVVGDVTHNLRRVREAAEIAAKREAHA